MKIKIDGEEVEVRAQECRHLKCLIVGYAVRRSSVGYSGCPSRVDDFLSCTHRHNVGCPQVPERQAPEKLHQCRVPQWLLRVRTPEGRGNVRCYNCGLYWPRWLAFEQQEKARAERAAQEKARADAEGCATCEEKGELGPPCMRR